MKFKDTQIHQIELLLTLDYLLNYTDKNHPATQQSICRHANNFGLRYDSKTTKGNDVRRQRVGECLQFLQYICYKFKDTDKIPFIINSTESGKFYIEEKNHLNEEQIIKVLAAIKNDKYTRDEDTEFLINKLLDSLSNRYNRDYFKQELVMASKGTKKYNFAANRKIRLINKAFYEKKMIKLRYEIIDKNKQDIHVYDLWYRVYKIKEFKNKPYAILLPITIGKIEFYSGIVFDAIENFNIPKGRDCDVIFQDYDDNRDLNKLFTKINKVCSQQFDNIDKMLEKNVIPQDGFSSIMSFYFNLGVKKFVKQSFEDFFSQPLEYVKCASFDVLEERQQKIKKIYNNKGTIVPHKLKDGEQPKYGVVNVSLNTRAFQSWVLSDPHGDSFVNIGDMITIVGPSFVNKAIAEYYYRHLIKFKNHLSDKTKTNVIDKFQN